MPNIAAILSSYNLSFHHLKIKWCPHHNKPNLLHHGPNFTQRPFQLRTQLVFVVSWLGRVFPSLTSLLLSSQRLAPVWSAGLTLACLAHGYGAVLPTSQRATHSRRHLVHHWRPTVNYFSPSTSTRTEPLERALPSSRPFAGATPTRTFHQIFPYYHYHFACTK